MSNYENLIRIMLVDDHAVVRAGLRRLIEHDTNFRICAEAESAERAYQLFSEKAPDLTIMDLSMPGMGGLEGIKRIVSRHPEAKIVVLSMHQDAVFATQAIKAGAKGYVTKSGLAEELIKAINWVLAGNTYLGVEVSNKIALEISQPTGDLIGDLSAREFEILRMLLDGLELNQIASNINISLKTAANYQTLIKQKLGVKNAIELIRLAMKSGLI
jgi:DNA-binding NarL/FixJ family response regulator